MTRRYIKYLIISILLFSIINIVYQIAVVDNPHFSLYDLAVNLLSEFAGMIFTVFIFNAFLNYRQQLTNTNKFRLLCNEISDLIKSLDFLFRTAARRCMADFNGDLWNEEVINTIRNRIMLSETDNCVFPAVPWYMIFSMQGEKLRRKCDNIRIQYQDISEPQISDYLFYLSNTSEMLTDLSDIKIIYENDLLLKYNRPKNLGSYFACPTDKDFEIIKKLNDWLDTAKKAGEQQTRVTRYNKIILFFLLVIFTIGAAGYYIRGSYLYAGLFSAIAIMLVVILFRYFIKKPEK